MAFGLASLLPASPADPFRAGFSPPTEPMRLTRELRRPLGNGDEIVSRRTYEVTFQRDGDGYVVDGQLIDVSVEVPQKLEALAELERKRPDVGMFPLRLDGDGFLLPEIDAQHASAVTSGVEMVSRQLGQLGLGAIDLARAKAFARQFLGRGGMTHWPQDLFHPVPGERRDERDMVVEGGEQGDILVEIDARTDASSGMMRSFERSVTTRLGDSAQVTHETWTLDRQG